VLGAARTRTRTKQRLGIESHRIAIPRPEISAGERFLSIGPSLRSLPITPPPVDSSRSHRMRDGVSCLRNECGIRDVRGLSSEAVSLD
jgi:hypothetical protein